MDNINSHINVYFNYLSNEICSYNNFLDIEKNVLPFLFRKKFKKNTGRRQVRFAI